MFIKKISLKYFCTILFFLALLFILYLSSNISLLSIGFLFDSIFIVGFISLLFFSIGSDKALNIVITIFASLIAILFIADHIYYSNFEKFASITSLNNLGMVMDNAEAYGVSLDYISFLMLLLLTALIIFLFKYKEENRKFKNRYGYGILVFLIFVPFIFTYVLAYNDIVKLDMILFPKRYKFPDFVTNFGYLIYRYEDIAVIIDNAIGG